LIVAPNLPEQYFEELPKFGVDFITGEFPVGPEYPASVRYNAVATDKLLIHNFRHTDFMITRTLEDLHPVHVDQGYTRCNLLPLRDGHFITSDEGIYKVLKGLHPDGVPFSPPNQLTNSTVENNSEGLHPDGVPMIVPVSPENILLPGFPHGFFGGCCGVLEDKVFINGSLSHLPEGQKVREFLEELDYEIVELADGPLVDVGSILFVI
jgi:hypothetical protein